MEGFISPFPQWVQTENQQKNSRLHQQYGPDGPNKEAQSLHQDEVPFFSAMWDMLHITSHSGSPKKSEQTQYGGKWSKDFFFFLFFLLTTMEWSQNPRQREHENNHKYIEAKQHTLE